VPLKYAVDFVNEYFVIETETEICHKSAFVVVSSGVISSTGIRCGLATFLTMSLMINEVNTVLYTTRLSNGNGAKLKRFDPTLVIINKQENKG